MSFRGDHLVNILTYGIDILAEEDGTKSVDGAGER